LVNAQVEGDEILLTEFLLTFEPLTLGKVNLFVVRT
jgi:hypothetical protein